MYLNPFKPASYQIKVHVNSYCLIEEHGIFRVYVEDISGANIPLIGATKSCNHWWSIFCWSFFCPFIDWFLFALCPWLTSTISLITTIILYYAHHQVLVMTLFTVATSNVSLSPTSDWRHPSVSMTQYFTNSTYSTTSTDTDKRDDKTTHLAPELLYLVIVLTSIGVLFLIAAILVMVNYYSNNNKRMNKVMVNQNLWHLKNKSLWKSETQSV